MVKHVVLVCWKPDADEQMIQEFMNVAPTALSRGPFLSFSHGVGLGLTGTSADWGFVADLAEADDLKRWTGSPAHSDFTATLNPIAATVTSIQLSLG